MTFDKLNVFQRVRTLKSKYDRLRPSFWFLNEFKDVPDLEWLRVKVALAFYSEAKMPNCTLESRQLTLIPVLSAQMKHYERGNLLSTPLI